ncbi:LytTR family DNA-binding domain-containing protein [Roseburia hominis]
MYEGRVLLVDDQPIAAEDSISALKHYVPEEQIVYAMDIAKAVKIMDSGLISLVFLDIEMPGMSGFELAAYIEKHHKKVPYVFLTGHADFALKSYDYEPVDFITKPVDVVRLGKTFEKVGKKDTPRGSEKVGVRIGQEYILFEPREILYICKEKRKIWVRLKDGREYQTAMTLDELEKIFCDYGFFRCHQSFVIPLSDIVHVASSKFGQTYEALLENGMVVPVSRNRYGELKEELEALGITFVKGVGSKAKNVQV